MSIYTDRVASTPGLKFHVVVVGALLFVASIGGLLTGTGGGTVGSLASAVIGLVLVRQARSAFHVRIENDKLTMRFLWIDQHTVMLSEESEFGYRFGHIPWVKSGSKRVDLFPLSRWSAMGRATPEADAMLKEFGLDVGAEMSSQAGN